MRKNININDLKETIIKNIISFWYTYRCSICNEPYGYYFYDNKVIFNGGCGCGSIYGDRLSSYNDIINLYNTSNNEQFKKEMLEYFKL